MLCNRPTVHSTSPCAGLTVPAGGRWFFWRNEAGKISLAYDHEEPPAAEAQAQAAPAAGPDPAPTAARPAA